VVSRRSLVPIDRDVPIEDAALLGCAVLTGLGAVVNTARVKPGSTVAIIGLGGVGLNSVLGGVLSGAREIIAIDLQADKLALALDLGATQAFDARDPDCIAKVREATKGGLDYAFEMAGSIPALETAFAITRRGGVTVTAGLPHFEKRMTLSPVTLVGEERTLMGSYVGGCVPGRDIPRYIDLYKRGRLPIGRLRSKSFRLDQINEGFDELASGAAARQVVLPHA
jgi:alcohol dehydrogenase